MVVHGFDSTVHATTEMMALHTAAVARTLKNKFLVADMPFLTFRKGVVPVLMRGKLMGPAHAVKLEGVWGMRDGAKDRRVRSSVMDILASPLSRSINWGI